VPVRFGKEIQEVSRSAVVVHFQSDKENGRRGSTPVFHFQNLPFTFKRRIRADPRNPCSSSVSKPFGLRFGVACRPPRSADDDILTLITARICRIARIGMTSLTLVRGGNVHSWFRAGRNGAAGGAPRHQNGALCLVLPLKNH